MFGRLARVLCCSALILMIYVLRGWVAMGNESTRGYRRCSWPLRSRARQQRRVGGTDRLPTAFEFRAVRAYPEIMPASNCIFRSDPAIEIGQ